MGSARVSLNGQEAQETHFLRLVLSLFKKGPNLALKMDLSYVTIKLNKLV
jgi:hypothetical protein